MASTHVGDTTLCGEVIIKTISDKAVITLNRPKSLNSLTLPMIKTINPFMKVRHGENALTLFWFNLISEHAI